MAENLIQRKSANDNPGLGVACLFPAVVASALCRGATVDSTLQTLIEAGHWKRAPPMAEQRYQASPKDAEAAYLLSEVKLAFGDVDGWRALAEKAVALAPKDSRFHRQLADAWFVANMLKEKPVEAGFGALIVPLGVPVYFIWRRTGRADLRH